MGWFWAGLHACIAVRSISFNFILLKLTPEQGSLESLAEDDGRDHPAAATPGVVPAGPKRDRGAPSAQSGPRASAADTEPGERQETNGRHTRRTSATCPALAGERRTLPGSGAAAPPPQPRATSTLRSNVAAAAPPAGRHFRVRRLTTPTLPAGTSGSSGSLLPPCGPALPGAGLRKARGAGGRDLAAF